MATRTYYCPDCEGCGYFTYSPSGCGNDPGATDSECRRCDGKGFLELDPIADDADGLRPHTPSRRRWAGLRAPMRRDWLESMAAARADAVKAKREGRNVRLTAYSYSKIQAMKPVTLRHGVRTTAEFMADVINPILYNYAKGSNA